MDSRRMKTRAPDFNPVRRWPHRLSTLTAACAAALLLGAGEA
ncbi:MAG: hypothetical protein WCK89_12125 [bacterium]